MDQSVSSLIKAKDIAATKDLFSDVLWAVVQTYGSTLDDVIKYDGYALSEGVLAASKGTTLTKSDLLGMQYLTKAKRIDFYTLTTTSGALFDISRFTNLEYLSCSSPSSLLGFFTGDISGLTKLKYVGNLSTACKFVNTPGSFAGVASLVNFTYTGVFNLPVELVLPNTMPIVGSNIGIKYFDISGNYIPYGSITEIGDLANCPLLSRFSMSNNVTPTSVCNYILQRLLTQKQQGGAIAYIKLNGSITDTASKNALVALGVTVVTL